MQDALPRALQGGPRITKILAAAAEELSGGEMSLERCISLLMRSRWPTLARGWETDEPRLQDKRASELGRIAALFDLDPLAGEASEHFRGRLRSHVHLHRRGLTTASSLLELAAALYLPREEPTILWRGDLATTTLRVRDAAGESQTIRLELTDNPIRRRSCDAVLTDERGSELAANPDGLVVDNGGLDPATPTLSITAETTVVLPELLHIESDLRLLYLGRLAAGDRLVIERERPALLNGRPAPAPLILADPATFDEPSSFFSYQTMDDGDLVVRGARFSRSDRWCAGDPGFFSLPCGPSRLRWRSVPKTELGRLIAHWPDRDAVLERAFSGAGAPERARLRLSLSWREAQAATFSLRVPADIIPWHRRENPALHWNALARVIENGRASGVRGVVELRPPILREQLQVRDHLRARVLVALRDRIALRDRSTADGVSALLPGVFDRSAFELAFADTSPRPPAGADAPPPEDS